MSVGSPNRLFHAMQWRLRTALQRAAMLPYFGTAERIRLLRLVGITGLEDCSIQPGVKFSSSNVSIGDGSFVNRGCLFDGGAPIVIGRNVMIGVNCQFITGTHELGSHELRAGPGKAEPITVGNGTWIGAGVTILPGVSLGEGCVIAAGAVVVKSTVADGLYGGVPARLIRQLD